METYLSPNDFAGQNILPKTYERQAAAYPLITHDPYFSIWSFADKINGDHTRHWSGYIHDLIGMVRIDGVVYHILGNPPSPFNNKIVNAEQIGLKISATQTIYSFQCGKAKLQLTFISPLLMDDLEILSRPVSYISYKIIFRDKEQHEVQVYFGASTTIASNESHQVVEASGGNTSLLNYLRSGTEEQPVLEKKGDDLRIDWGYLYVAASTAQNTNQYVTSRSNGIDNFIHHTLPEMANRGNDLILNTVFPSEIIAGEKEYLLLIGYDDIFSINYFDTPLRPWWNRNNDSSIEDQLDLAYKQYHDIIARCESFDMELHDTAEVYGGEAYARMLDLGYRQCIAAHKLVESPEGKILFLSKENYSNGYVNTVDVTYPSSPLFLMYNTDLLKGMLNGIFHYSENGKWTKPFPAHDLGAYPIATGQTYHEDMAVEEAGNMLILAAAIAKAEGNAHYALEHWKSLTTWVNFLAEQGFDPEKQLCTDDFAGHLARNANLSVKAITAIGSYGYLAGELGYLEKSREYLTLARSMAEMWMILADAGDHYALTFNDKNTWSLKYNLVWDKLLELDIFPQKVYNKEMAYYESRINKYGLPLDCRSDYTKSDWVIWIAGLTENIDDFRKFTEPLYLFEIETEDRVPMTHCHYTSRPKMEGFQARSVVGGYFIKLLKEEWKKEKFYKELEKEIF
ncbi:hypothetical protein BH23BAC2_BH23BAC2_17040 [soil metagenome]